MPVRTDDNRQGRRETAGGRHERGSRDRACSDNGGDRRPRRLSARPSAWLTTDQDRVDAFARTVEDWHWAHNDPDRAGRGPFGTTIGHAHLSLSIIPGLFSSLLAFAEGEDCMFYGYNRARFPTAVPVGARVRLRADIVTVEERTGAEELLVDVTIELEGSERPACVAQALFRHYHLAAPD